MNQQKVLVAVGAMLALISVGCGSSADDVDTDSVTTSTTARATTVPELDLDAWGEEVLATYERYQLDRTAAASGFVEVILSRAGHVEEFGEALIVDAEATERAISALDVASGDDELDAALGALVTALRDHAEVNAAVQSELATNAEAWQDEIDQASGESFGTALGDALDTVVAGYEATDRACFDAQGVFADRALGVIDCAGSSVEDGEAAAAQGIDPRLESTGSTEAELPAGEHTFEIFEPGLKITTQRTLLFRSGPAHVEVIDPERDRTWFAVFDLPEVYDPSDPRAALEGSAPLVELPADFGGHLRLLPLTILNEGELEVDAGDARFWDVMVDLDAIDELGIDPVVILARIEGVTDVAAFEGFPARFLLWKRGDRSLVVWAADDLDSSAALIEEVLATAR